jgi:hypothetical protein
MARKDKKNPVDDEPKNVGGRPHAVIDWETVDKLCMLHCKGEEIADIIKVDYDTLNLACKREKKKGFTDYYKEKSSTGKLSLRRRQYTAAVDEGNTTMLIWLGKQWLGQTDKKEFDHTSSDGSMSPQKIEIVAPNLDV